MTGAPLPSLILYSRVGCGLCDETRSTLRALLEQRRAAGLPANLKLLAGEQTQWNDSSLGCPQPGTMYTQAITTGYVLRFADRNATHEVHVAGDDAIVCTPQLGTGVPQRSTAAYRARDLDAVIESARADLAAKLNLQLEEVSLRNFEPATWPDSRLGCGEQLADAAPAPDFVTVKTSVPPSVVVAFEIDSAGAAGTFVTV